jgi:hypothetical protein
MIINTVKSFIEKALLVGLFGLSLGVMPHALAASDVRGSSDDTSIDRYRGSWIVNYRLTPDADYRLVLGGIETVNGVERPESSQRLSGQLTRITYQIPQGTRTRELNRFFTDQLKESDAELLFTCNGRACGSSTVWANQVFNESTLLGLVDSQFVITAKLPGQYAVVYIVERGNRKVYAHLDLIETDAAARIGADALDQGFAILAIDQQPDIDVITQINQQIVQEGRQATLVVHHKGNGFEDALEKSQRLAEQLSASLLARNVDIPVTSVGAWVPSVLQAFTSVVVLVIEG